MKVTIVGAGNVGATAANVIFAKNIAQDLILVDIKEGLAEGKVMDMLQTAHMLNITTRLLGCSNDYSKPLTLTLSSLPQVLLENQA